MAWVSPVTTIEAMLDGRYQAAVEAISPAPIAYWLLDEDPGATTAVDISGTAQNLTYAGGVTHALRSPFSGNGRVATFDGVDGRASRADATLAPTAAVTLALWMRPTNVAKPIQRIGGFGDASDGYLLYMEPTDTRLRWAVNPAAGGVHSLHAGLANGQTYFVVGTFDDATNTQKLYVNGALVDSDTNANGAIDYGAFTSFVLGNDGNLFADNYFVGDIYHVALWDVAISSADVTALWNAAQFADISADLTNDPIVIGPYGIRSNQPQDRCASTGELRFGLRNDANNSGSTLGWYSIDSPTRRTGWNYGILIRAKQVYAGDTRYFLARLEQAVVEPGSLEGRKVHCVAVDYIDELARAPVRIGLQQNIRSDAAVSAILANMATAPALTALSAGRDTYRYVFDRVGAQTKALTVLSDLARSELAYIFSKRDATRGQTFTFQTIYDRILNTTVAITLTNSMHVLDMPGDRHDIINVFRVMSRPRVVSGSPVVIAALDAPLRTPIAPGKSLALFLNYTDPVQRDTRIAAADQIAPVATTDYTMNQQADGTGVDATADFTVSAEFFATSVKLTIQNLLGAAAEYVMTLQVRGTSIKTLQAVTAEASIEASVDLYGENAVDYDMPFQDDPTVAQAVADYLVALYEQPFAHVRAVSFIANQSAALLTAALTLDIGDRIALAETVTGLASSQHFHINGVQLEVTEREVVTCTWWLTPADAATTWWVLGTSTLGTDTIPFYL